MSDVVKLNVRATARRCKEGWRAVVLAGERYHYFGVFPSKRIARKNARKHAAQFRAAQHH